MIGEHLADGRLNLTTLAELRDVLCEERLDEILSRAAGRTEDEVKALVAVLAPQPAPMDLFRRLPQTRIEPPVSVPSSGPEQQTASSGPELPRRMPGTGGRAATVRPISADLHVVRLTVDAAFTQDLEAVRAALSHQIPDGNVAAVLHECVRVTLAAARKRRRGAGRPSKPNTTTPRTDTRYVPVAVRDEVWRRDQGRCAFVSDDGRRCGSTHQLELHHLVPFARGGEATVQGLALRCRPHNLHEARRDFGDEHITQAIADARGWCGISRP